MTIPTQRSPWDDDPEVARIAAQDEERAARQAGAWPYGSLEQLAAATATAHRFCGYTAPHATHNTRTPEGTDAVCPGYRADAAVAAPAMPHAVVGPDGIPVLLVEREPQHARPAYIEPPNHVLHGLLTLFTGGAWAVVWIIRVRKYRKAVRRANR